MQEVPWYAPRRFAHPPSLMILGAALFLFKQRKLGAAAAAAGALWFAYERGKVAAYFPKGS